MLLNQVQNIENLPDEDVNQNLHHYQLIKVHRYLLMNEFMYLYHTSNVNYRLTYVLDFHFQFETRIQHDLVFSLTSFNHY
jgi:hypothetical protein